MKTRCVFGAIVLLGTMLSCATVPPDPPPAGSVVACTSIAGLPGPEDLVLDRWHQPPRLLVSSYDRWGRADEGGIYAIDPNTDRHTGPLVRVGEPKRGDPGYFAFRPQGIDLWKNAQGEVLLAAAIHGSDAPQDQVVALYKLKGDTLEFIDAIRDLKWIVDPNDVAFAPDGTLYVTNFGDAGRAPWTYAVGRPASTLVNCDPTKSGRRCSVVARNISGGNGIIVRNGKAIAASFFGGYLFDVERSPRDGQVFLKRFARVPYPDNMTMADDRTVLITSQALPALALHARFKASAPSAVYRLNPDTIGASPTLLFQDNGESIRAASTALWYGKKLYLGQPFGDGVLVVPIPDTGVDGVLRCELPAGDAKKETAVNAATPSR